jgi:hypothetical protein
MMGFSDDAVKRKIKEAYRLHGNANEITNNAKGNKKA